MNGIPQTDAAQMTAPASPSATAPAEGKPSTPVSRNGAYCNEYGSIYLRIVSLDTTKPDWPMKSVSHGISIEEAHIIATELLQAIHQASLIKTGRIPSPH